MFQTNGPCCLPALSSPDDAARAPCACLPLSAAPGCSSPGGSGALLLVPGLPRMFQSVASGQHHSFSFLPSGLSPADRSVIPLSSHITDRVLLLLSHLRGPVPCSCSCFRCLSSRLFLPLPPPPPCAAPELPIHGFSLLPWIFQSRISAPRMFGSGWPCCRPVLSPRMFKSWFLALVLFSLLPPGCSSPCGPAAVHSSPSLLTSPSVLVPFLALDRFCLVCLFLSPPPPCTAPDAPIQGHSFCSPMIQSRNFVHWPPDVPDQWALLPVSSFFLLCSCSGSLRLSSFLCGPPDAPMQGSLVLCCLLLVCPGCSSPWHRANYPSPFCFAGCLVLSRSLVPFSSHITDQVLRPLTHPRGPVPCSCSCSP